MSGLRLGERAWSRALVAALRRWWWLPVAGAVLAGLTGFLVARSSPATATSQVGVQLVSSGGDSTLVEQVVAGALERLGSRSVLQDAAKARGESYSDLSARTSITEVGTSTILQIAVTSPDADKAAADANAVAQAGIKASSASLQAALDDVTGQSEKIISGNKLSNSRIENARQTAVAESLGAAQTDLVARYGSLISVSDATADDASRPGALGLAMMAAAGGALLGLGVALLLGARRGPARSIGEMRSAAPHATVVQKARRGSLLRLEAARRRLVVLAPFGDEDEQVSESLAELQAGGAHVVNVPLRALRDPSLVPAGAVGVIEEPASPELAGLATGSDDVLLVVLTRNGQARLEDLGDLDASARGSYVVATN